LIDLQELADVAVAAAADGGAQLLARWRRDPTGVSTKSTPTDLVSDADRAAEAAIVAVLRARRPADAVFAEEAGAVTGGSSGVRWVVDPLDGTVNYLYGSPNWAVSIAAEIDGTAVVGVVLQPPTGEVFVATAGSGCRVNGEPASVSHKGDLTTALVATGFAYSPELRAAQAGVVMSVIPRVRDIRREGSAALDLAWVSCGRLDGFFETGLGPWDVAAGQLLVTEAGGCVVELLPPPGHAGVGVVASGPGLSRQLCELVQGPAPSPR